MDKNYWDKIYRSKSEQEVSWYQETPAKSLELIAELGLGPDDSIIDIGGGESRLVDHLLVRGFKNISILENRKSRNRVRWFSDCQHLFQNGPREV